MAGYDRGPGSYGFMNPAPMPQPVNNIDVNKLFHQSPIPVVQSFPPPARGIYDKGPGMTPSYNTQNYGSALEDVIPPPQKTFSLSQAITDQSNIPRTDPVLPANTNPLDGYHPLISGTADNLAPGVSDVFRQKLNQFGSRRVKPRPISPVGFFMDFVNPPLEPDESRTRRYGEWFGEMPEDNLPRSIHREQRFSPATLKDTIRG